MEFEAVLEQTIAILQRQGRISYGALKRRFELDDAYLEDLKIELISDTCCARWYYRARHSRGGTDNG